jgi:hypothetical protein
MLRTSRSLQSVNLSLNGILPDSQAGISQNQALAVAVEEGGYEAQREGESDTLVLTRGCARIGST